MNTFYTILCIKHPLTKKYSIRHMILHVNLIIFTYTNLNVGLTTIKRFIFFSSFVQNHMLQDFFWYMVVSTDPVRVDISSGQNVSIVKPKTVDV